MNKHLQRHDIPYRKKGGTRKQRWGDKEVILMEQNRQQAGQTDMGTAWLEVKQVKLRAIDHTKPHWYFLLPSKVGRRFLRPSFSQLRWRMREERKLSDDADEPRPLPPHTGNDCGSVECCAPSCSRISPSKGPYVGRKVSQLRKIEKMQAQTTHASSLSLSICILFTGGFAPRVST